MRSTRAKKSAQSRHQPLQLSHLAPQRCHLGFQFGGIAKVEFFPDPDLPPGSHQAFPLIRIFRDLACQQNFDAPAQKISCRRIVRA